MRITIRHQHIAAFVKSFYTVQTVIEHKIYVVDNGSKDNSVEIFEKAEHPLHVVSTTDRIKALEGADYVISSCEKNRYANWALDLAIPEKNGVYQIKGENGGPGA